MTLNAILENIKIGAVLPAKEGSRYDVAQRTMYQAQLQRYTA